MGTGVALPHCMSHIACPPVPARNTTTCNRLETRQSEARLLDMGCIGGVQMHLKVVPVDDSQFDPTPGAIVRDILSQRSTVDTILLPTLAAPFPCNLAAVVHGRGRRTRVFTVRVVEGAQVGVATTARQRTITVNTTQLQDACGGIARRVVHRRIRPTVCGPMPRTCAS